MNNIALILFRPAGLNVVGALVIRLGRLCRKYKNRGILARQQSSAPMQSFGGSTPSYLDVIFVGKYPTRPP
jgi:hypothetical protein